MRMALKIRSGLFVVLVALIASCDSEHPSKHADRVRVSTGDPDPRGGRPTIRRSFPQLHDDPRTPNDESNDQPLGHFGTATVHVHSYGSGNTYTLDADVEGASVTRIYFPKGGWVDFLDCEIGVDLQGHCTDEQGRAWEFEGASGGYYPDVSVEEEDDEDADSDAERADEAQAEDE